MSAPTRSTGVLGRLDDLTSRLEAVERRLGMERVQSPVVIEVPRPPSRTMPVVVRPDVRPAVPPMVPTAPVASPARPPALPAASPEPPDPGGLREAERLVGGRVYLVAGALVVVIGVGLFLKLGYDAGWFRMTPMWKCIWGGVFGLTLLGAGEAARRNVSAFASAGLSAAGIGALYASAYAAHGLWALVEAPIALALLSVVTILGILVAARARLLVVAVLSVVGGYAAPFILTEHELRPIVLPLYLLAILVVGLGLSGWRPIPFRPVRTLVWIGTVAIGSIWLLWQGRHHAELSLPFLALVWGAVHLELLASVRRAVAVPSSSTPVYDDAPALAAAPPVAWRRARPIATSFATSLWTVASGVLVLREQPVLPDWFVPAGGVVGTVFLALILAGNLRILRDVPRTDAERLGAGLLMQAGGLLIAAVALALTGWMEVCAWLGMGMAFCAAGAWIRSRGLSLYGVVMLSIATVRLIAYDSWAMRFTWPDTEVLGLVLGPWALLMALGAVAWVVSARLLAMHAGEIWRNASRIAACVGLSLPALALLRPEAQLIALCAAFLALGLAEVGVGSWRRWSWLCGYGMVCMLLGSVALLVFGPDSPETRGHELGLGGLALGRWAAAVAGGGIAWLACAAAVRRLKDGRTISRVAASVGLGLLFLCVLHPKAELMSICAAWLALGSVVAVIALAARIRWLSLGAMLPLALGAGALTLYGLVKPEAHAGALDVLGLSLGRWWLLMLGAASAWGLVARLFLRFGDDTSDRAARVGATVAMALLLASFLSPEVAWDAVAWVWLGIGVASVFLSALQKRLELDRLGLAAIAASAFAWITAFPLLGWTATAGDMPVHPGLLQAAAIVMSAGLVGWWLWRRTRAEPDRLRNELKLLAGGAGALAFAATSLEVARIAARVASDPTAQGAALSIWWGLFAVGLIAVGFLRHILPARYAGLALLGVATAKALLLDLADVPPAWRVASVLGLGLLMLGVAVAYARIAAKLTAARAPCP